MSRIYKITNIINNKIYIGHTLGDIQVRFNRHVIDARYRKKSNRRMSYFQNAILKYGKDNFEIECIHETGEGENWEELEIGYIDSYNSTNSKVGYNLSSGGNSPPPIYGDDNNQARLTNDEFMEIVEHLKCEELRFQEIADLYGVHITTVEGIDVGRIRHTVDIEYPIRKNNINELKIFKVMSFLVDTEFSYELIGDIVGVSRVVCNYVNLGQRHVQLAPNIKYPIRKHIEHNRKYTVPIKYDSVVCYKTYLTYCKGDEHRFFNITSDIILSEDNLIVIAKKYGVDPSLISRINTGKQSHRLPRIFKYPLRQNIKSNKKTLNELEAVETIPLIGK